MLNAEKLTSIHLKDVLSLQDEVFQTLGDNQEWLRYNSPETMRYCLTSDDVIGVKRENRLVAVAVLQNVQKEEDSILQYVKGDTSNHLDTMNLKVVFISEACRRTGIAQQLVEQLSSTARSYSKKRLLCTIHPDNEPSQKLFIKAGYEHIDTAMTSYGPRHIFNRDL